MRAVSHLRILLRAEALIAEAKLRGLMRRGGLMAGAGVVALFALAMLNVAGFFALQPAWGPAWAALVVAVADLVVALVIALIAMASRQSPEVKAAEALRDSAVEGLQADFGGFAVGAAIPLLTAIIQALRRGKK
jgi:hypothetical protein